MEVVPKRASIVKEEKKMDSCGDSVEEVEKIGSEKKTGGGGSLKSSSPNQRDSSTSNQVSIVIASERLSMDTSSRPSPSNTRGPTSINQEDQLESTKAEMGEVREENERLKTHLARIVKDYQSLQMHFLDIVQQEQSKKPAETLQPAPRDDEEPDHLVSLSLGTNPSVHKKEEKDNTVSKSKDNDQIEEGLTLGLDCKYEGSSNGTNEPASNNTSPSNSIEETKDKEEEAGEPWPPSKILKNLRSGPEDEVSQQAHVKKTRVSVRARCDAPTMHDGCQWRKYGQKIAKGNPCPRAYYRCTVAPACPVRKQVQRCAEDMSILITTYEGTHNHPLPISATAMASTTSAAACMLMSGSSTSRPPAIGSSPSSSSPLTTAAATISSSNPNLHALNFNLTDPNLRSRPLFYLPNSTISSTPSYPTITLDLTSPPQVSSQASQFSRFPSANFNTSSTTRYSTSFNFSSPESSTTSWANAPYLSYQQPYNKSPIGSLGFSASKQQDNLYQSYLEKVVNPIGVPVATQHVLTDTIAKAITSDPSFQSALAAAITSYVGGGTSAAQNGGEGASLGSLAPYSSTPATVNGCGSSFLTRTTSGPASSTQQGSSGLKFLQPPPLTFSSSKSASASPVDNRENIN